MPQVACRETCFCSNNANNYLYERRNQMTTVHEFMFSHNCLHMHVIPECFGGFRSCFGTQSRCCCKSPRKSPHKSPRLVLSHSCPSSARKHDFAPLPSLRSLGSGVAGWSSKISRHRKICFLHNWLEVCRW